METLIQLILRVRNGDNVAFEILCDQYKPLLTSMVHKYSQMCEEDNSDDLLQEAKMAFYNAILTFDIEQSKVTFGYYVKRCIRNKLISCVRKAHSKKRRQQIEASQTTDASTPQDSILQYELTKEFLSLAKEILSDYEMQILMMYISGLRAKEISAATGKSEKSVNNAIYRIRSKLKKRINGGT